MKFKKTALLMALCLLVSVFAGCQSSELREYTESTDAAQDTTVEAAAVDYTPAFEAFEPDTVMLTVNDIQVTWQELFYWYYYDVSMLNGNFGQMPDWDEISIFDSSKTYREYITENALNTVKHYCALESKAADAGVKLTQEDLDAIDASWQASVDSYGGGDEEAFTEYLKGVYLSRELFLHINEINALYNRLMNELYGENGEKLTAKEVLDEAEAQGYMRFKHIFFSTKDETTGEELSQEEKDAKRAEAEEILARLQAVSDPAEQEALMDELIIQVSDDSGGLYYPDGYTYLPNTMTAAVEDCVKGLQPGQLSGIVESGLPGYHIILRLPLDPQAISQVSSDGLTSYTLAGIIAHDIYDKATTAWADESKVVFSEEYQKMDIAEIFGKAITA